jgi:tetratricopeptide (TPR) repeat protein
LINQKEYSGAELASPEIPTRRAQGCFPYELSETSGSEKAQIASVLMNMGKTDEAEKIIDEIKDGAKKTNASFTIARTYAALKRKEETLEWLEYAYEARSNFILAINDDRFAWLRSDPHFQDLVRRVDPPPR